MQNTTSPSHRSGARTRFQVRPVAAACALLAAASGNVQAQQTQPAEGAAQTIVVTGIRRAIESSIATKRNSDSIVEAISSRARGSPPVTPWGPSFVIHASTHAATREYGALVQEQRRLAQAQADARRHWRS